MSDAMDNLVLDQLRQIRANGDASNKPLSDLVFRVGMLETNYASMQSQFAHMSVRIDRVDDRLDRIERRLGLGDA
jgi:hypothetical protein